MALTDPELDLLRELLVDEPTEDVFLQVGEELVRRGLWLDAKLVLAPGLAAHTHEVQGWCWLARACLELNEPAGALDALSHLSIDIQAQPEAARIRILALERGGQRDDAGCRCDEFLAIHPGDVVVESVVERLEAPVQAEVVPLGDPFITVERAKQYVAIGRPDRAIRVLRRVLFQRPGDPGAEGLLRQLEGTDVRMAADDLSEEIINPATMPASMDMPAPRLQAMVADDEDTEPRRLSAAIEAFARGKGAHPLPEEFSDDELTDPLAALPDDLGKLPRTATGKPKKRRRRRSLLNR